MAQTKDAAKTIKEHSMQEFFKAPEKKEIPFQDQMKAFRKIYSSGKAIILPFDDLTEKGLEPFIKKFKKLKCNIVEVDAKNKGKREDGYLIKRFSLKFDDGQKLTFSVKSDGVVYQVKLNSTVIPVRHIDNIDLAVADIVGSVQRTAEAFRRAKIQKEIRKAHPNPPKVTTTRKQKIEQLQQTLDQLTQTNSDLEKQINATAQENEAKRSALKMIQESLEGEKQRTELLKSEIDKYKTLLQQQEIAASTAATAYDSTEAYQKAKLYQETQKAQSQEKPLKTRQQQIEQTQKRLDELNQINAGLEAQVKAQDAEKYKKISELEIARQDLEHEKRITTFLTSQIEQYKNQS